MNKRQLQWMLAAVRLYTPVDGKIYRLDGTPATSNTRGIVIEDGKRKIVK